MLGWMTHHFLGVPRLRICSRRHGALPLAGQALTGCWQVQKNTLEPQALSESIPRVCLQEPLASAISQTSATLGRRHDPILQVSKPRHSFCRAPS